MEFLFLIQIQKNVFIIFYSSAAKVKLMKFLKPKN
jgi:hypothetical protein